MEAITATKEKTKDPPAEQLHAALAASVNDVCGQRRGWRIKKLTGAAAPRRAGAGMTLSTYRASDPRAD